MNHRKSDDTFVLISGVFLDLFFYRGSEPNFGDELNQWMWPRLIQDCWDRDDNTLFVGIGSVLETRFPSDKLKIIFGAGYGAYGAAPTLNDTWKVFFVRGKNTAKTLGIAEDFGIGDSAILLRSLLNQTQNNKPEKKYAVSFMPHFKSLSFGNWELAAKLAGINFIDPRQDVESIISQILASKHVLAEAMHGAIVADALRVPWIALEPIYSLNRMKWLDWASALNLSLVSEKLAPSSLPEKIADYCDAQQLGHAKKIRKKTVFLKGILPQYFAEQAAERLSTISKLSPNLSEDCAIEMSHERMQENLYQLVKFIGKGKVLI